MRFDREIQEQYQKAYALGRRQQHTDVKHNLSVYPSALDTLVAPESISYTLDLGILDIPVNLIVGIDKDSENAMQYTKDFLPLSQPNSKFAEQWRMLYNQFLSDEGLTEAVRCYEYMGRFYVSDGLKRVSVVKFHGASTIKARVIRLMPVRTDDKDVALYYAFLSQYRLTRLYQLQFTQPGYFEKLQAALGHAPTYKWNESDRYGFLFHWVLIENAFRKSYDDYLNITAADALVVLLEKYSYEQIIRMEPWVLTRVFQAIWRELYTLSFPDFKHRGKKEQIPNDLQTA